MFFILKNGTNSIEDWGSFAIAPEAMGRKKAGPVGSRIP